ncbi:sulfur carrier protein ThiS [Streptomyces polyrhachis]|uniref:Sulfur carrier protein ThiS n=1 Tax=Streptomyces polyrhachis TaxID=1282885 RepID=A0ABW2G9R9_9ACTN
MSTISVNGRPRELPPGGLTLAALVAALSPAANSAAAGLAAAVNEAVVPRSRWSATELRAGDRVEVLTAVQGG